MAYYRKRNYARRPRKSRKVITHRKPKVNVYSLAKKVSYLAKRQRATTEKVQYTVDWDQNVSSNYFAVSLVRPFSWTSVFGESENVIEAKRLNITKLNLDWLLSPSKESAEINYTVFLISARNNKVFQETNNLTTFQNNPNGQQDYTDVPITYMNPKRFKIWKVWRVQTSGITTRVDGSLQPTTNVVNTNHYARRYMKMPFKRYLQNNTTQQSWKQLQNNEIAISTSLSLVFMNNNSLADLENPNCKGSAIFSCYV